MILPARCNENARQHLKVMGDLGQIVNLDYSIRDDDAIKYAVERSNVVVNMVGREWETRNFSFHDVHVDFPARLAEICKSVGTVDRLIHVSALGAAEDHPSDYYRTKAIGDAAVSNAFPNATIVKPAKLIGTEDRLLNVFAEHACKFPATPLIDDGGSKHRPVFVDDVALAIQAMVEDPTTAGKTFELCGDKVYTMEDLVKLTNRVIRAQNPKILYVPSFIMKLLGAPHEYLLKKVPFPLPTPTGLTRSYIEAQSRDYLKHPKSLGFEELGIKPAKLDGVVIDYLRAFRFGGYDAGSAVGQPGMD